MRKYTNCPLGWESRFCDSWFISRLREYFSPCQLFHFGMQQLKIPTFLMFRGCVIFSVLLYHSFTLVCNNWTFFVFQGCVNIFLSCYLVSSFSLVCNISVLDILCFSRLRDFLRVALPALSLPSATIEYSDIPSISRLREYFALVWLCQLFHFGVQQLNIPNVSRLREYFEFLTKVLQWFLTC